MTTGSCLCGDVRFEVSRFSSALFKCHCSLCRKAFGGASSAAALATADDFRWLRGEESIREFRKTPGFRRRFCAQCGSILPQHLAGQQLYWVPAGLLDSDPGVPLKRHIHVASKAAWEILDEQTPCLDGGFDTPVS